MLCFRIHPIYALLLLLQLSSVWGNDSTTNSQRYPSELAFSVGIIPSSTFNGFFDDLIENIQENALHDNITISFETEDVEDDYEAALSLLDPTSNSSTFDFLIGDFWLNPDHYELCDFTPPLLTSSMSAMKCTVKENSTDINSLTEAVRIGSTICGVGSSSFLQGHTLKNFPDATIKPCQGENAIQSCLKQLESEECSLFVADELVLRSIQSDKENLEVTGEYLLKQYLVWPVRKNMDPTKAFLLNKWIYTALSSQALDNLYTKYFEKKSCPVGWAGMDCDLPCDPLHGIADDATGKCICSSVRWTGADCSIAIPEELNMIPNNVKYTAYGMFALNASIIFICAIWLYNNWWTSQVRYSQPIFLLLILLGCLISSSSIVPMGQEDSGDGPVEACIAVPWLYSLGFSITFGTLFAKIRRIYSIFNQQERPVSGSVRQLSLRGRGYISTKETLCTIGGVLLLDLTVLTLWAALDPLHWERTILREDQFGNSLESQGWCTSNHWKPFLGVLVAIHVSLVALATYMCYKARGIPTEYSEHKYVTVAMIANLQLFILGIPVLAIGSTGVVAHFFVRSAVVWMNDLVIISLIFGNLINKLRLSNADVYIDKVQGAVDDIVRRRSGEHSRRASLGDSDRSDSIIQRRNSGGYTPTRRSSLGNSDRTSLGNSDRKSLGNSGRYTPAMPNVAEDCSTGQSSVDLESDLESSQIDHEAEKTPHHSSVSDISLSGFEPSESSEDDHNSGSHHDSNWRPSKGPVPKSRFAQYTDGDVPMIPLRDQTIVEEVEEEEEEVEDDSSYTHEDAHKEALEESKDGGSAELRRMHLTPIQENDGVWAIENRHRPSLCSLQPPLLPSRSPSSKEDDSVSRTSNSSVSLNSTLLSSPKSASPQPKRSSLSSSENAPIKPIRLESEHEVIDYSGHTSEHRRVAIDIESPSSYASNPYQAPLKPMRFLSEAEEIDSSRSSRIYSLPT